MRKYVRQAKIAELIQCNNISSQKQLVDLLKESGVVISQVTLSRDLAEMGVSKTRDAAGGQIYNLPLPPADNTDLQALKLLFRKVCVRVISADCLIVLHFLPGYAGIMKDYLLRIQLSGIAGAIADADQVWLLCFERKDAEAITSYLRADLLADKEA